MDIPTVFHSESAVQTADFGYNFAQSIIKRSKKNDKPLIVCLFGELGSGKTTFTQGFAKGLGYENRLLSPTFLIMRTYELSESWVFHHLDLYRVHTEHDLETLGLSEIFSDPRAVIMIEWPEKIPDLIPKARWELRFENNGEDLRTIRVNQIV